MLSKCNLCSYTTGADVTDAGLVVVSPSSWNLPAWGWESATAVSVSVLSDGLAKKGAVAKTFTVKFECASLDASFHGGAAQVELS